MSKKSTRVDLACQALRRAIIEQALPPGTKLPEDELGARFAMSRTLVRAALAQLQSEGLVDAPPRRTATTAKPTLEEAKEVFEVRRMLEREVVRLVIARWRPEFGAELEGQVREEEAARKNGDARVSGRLAGEFHVKLGELSGNRAAAALSRRGGFALFADPCALWTATFRGLLRQRAPRDRRGPARAQRRCRDFGDGPSSRSR